MQITLLFFGVLTEVTGSTEYKLNAELTDINSLNNYLYSQYPELTKHKYTIAVNGEMVSNEKKLEEGDEVAFLPPFAGG